MPLNSQWNRAQLRTSARNELQDSGAKWWTNAEVNKYLEDWQTEIQDLGEFVWGSATATTSTATHTITNLATNVGRLDRVYWNKLRLAARTAQDLEVIYREWKTATTGLPAVAYQLDDDGFVVWPPPVTTGTLEIEYATKVSFDSNDVTTMQVPAWTKYSAINYVAWKAYERLGPNMDLNKALRYKKKYESQAAEYKSTYAAFFPYKYPQLRPATKYEMRIIGPYTSFELGGSTSTSTNTYSVFAEYTPTGTMNGTNLVFTIPVVPAEMQLFYNGIYQVETTDYTLTGTSITMTVAPVSGDTLRALVYTGVVGAVSYVTSPTVEVPTGTMNGINTSFYVSPGYDNIALYLNGVLQIEGSDITFTGASGEVVWIGPNIPFTGDTLVAYCWNVVQPYVQYAYAPSAEIPSGTMNGTNVSFNMSVAPSVLMLYLNGQLLAEGIGYTRLGNTITMNSGYVPFTGDTLNAFYW